MELLKKIYGLLIFKIIYYGKTTLSYYTKWLCGFG